MRVLVLGVTGAKGHAVHGVLAADPALEVWGTMRHEDGRKYFTEDANARIASGIDVLDQDTLMATLRRIRPDVVINAVGIIKQLGAVNDPSISLPINSIFPHQLADLCALFGCRMVQFSTDCVFSGRQGNYRESDSPDAEDLYGQSKLMGEVRYLSHVITLRTSIIGHELRSNLGLVDWFLSQQGSVKGYERAIYSGLPSVELGRVIKDFVLTHPELHGLYHVSSKPITKLELLRLVAAEYNKDIEIIPDSNVAIDRALDSSRFTEATGYIAPEWTDLIKLLHVKPHTLASLNHV